MHTIRLAATLGLGVILAGATYAAPGQVALSKGEKTYVPVRSLAELTGAEVGFSKGVVTAQLAGKSITLRVGSRNATLNGKPVSLSTAPFILSSVTYIPLRFAAEAFGAEIEYRAAGPMVVIRRGETTITLLVQSEMEYSIAHQTTCAGLIKAMENAIRQHQPRACLAGIADPLPYFDETLTGDRRASEILGTFANYRGGSFRFPGLVNVTQREVNYAIEANGDSPWRLGDCYSGNEYTGIWVFRKLGGYWRCVMVTY